MASAHLVPHDLVWLVKVKGDERSRHFTQNAARDAARDYLAANGGGELVVHGVYGEVRGKDTVYADGTAGNVRGAAPPFTLALAWCAVFRRGGLGL